jgi:hypothetical protein
MSYQTGSASSPTDLVQKLVTWLVSIGWTQDRSATEGAGWTASLHKSANYVHLRAAENESSGPWQSMYGAVHYSVNMYLGTAFDSGQPFNNQTTGAPIGGGTNPIGVGMQLSAGPFSNYYFFADSGGDNIVVVVEKTPGLYLHMGWGPSLQKAGSYTGGPYFFGPSSGYYTSFTFAGANTPGYTSSSECPFANMDQIGGGCGFVRADVDSWTGKWVGIFNATGGANQGFTGKEGDTSVHAKNSAMKTNFPVYAYSAVPYQFQSEQTSQQDGRANLLPIILWALRDGTTTGFSMLGTPPNIFATNAIGNGFSNADEYVLGATTYKLFPNFAVVKQ